ncbi:MAG TPA: ATP-binding protein [Candidatus Limnocylindria bacterium]|nr:ATP-binding protein [Candidatus Limnocylindria bacterium]
MKVNGRDTVTEVDALAGVARVARMLVGFGGLSELTNDAVAEIGEALDLDLAALYLADPAESRVLRRRGKPSARGSRAEVVESVSLDAEAWRFVAASGGPLVFRERTAWVMENPFEPPADHWAVLPLISERQILGAVVGCSPEPISLAPAAVARLTVIGDLVSAGVSNALLRAEIQRTELERERLRLVEEIHDSLAQDLAVAVRELALLGTAPSSEVAQASQDRLREAVLEAHRIVRERLRLLSSDVPARGLEDSIEEIRARFRRRGLSVVIEEAVPDLGVHPAAVAVVVRVLNEALANVQRHASVTEATIAVTLNDGRLHVLILDEGEGFDVDGLVEQGAGHFGVAIMRQRAQAAGGTLRIRSRPAGGTTVELWLPIEGSVA